MTRAGLTAIYPPIPYGEPAGADPDTDIAGATWLQGTFKVSEHARRAVPALGHRRLDLNRHAG